MSKYNIYNRYKFCVRLTLEILKRRLQYDRIKNSVLYIIVSLNRVINKKDKIEN